jgi:hypothetical protein
MKGGRFRLPDGAASSFTSVAIKLTVVARTTYLPNIFLILPPRPEEDFFLAGVTFPGGATTAIKTDSSIFNPACFVP